MKRTRGFLLQVFVVCMAAYTIFAQPGMPPCWLEKTACEIHPHFSREQEEDPHHSHLYLIDLSLGLAAYPYQISHAETFQFFFLLATSGFSGWQGIKPVVIDAQNLSIPPEPPPPRGFSTFS